MAYGVPLTIMAPDSAVIKKEDWGSMQIITVKKGKDYDLQIQSSEATSTDIATVKAQKITDVKNERYFSKIIKGRSPADLSSKLNRIRLPIIMVFDISPIQGDKEYIIQNGLAGNYTLEQAEFMYEAIKPKDKK